MRLRVSVCVTTPTVNMKNEATTVLLQALDVLIYFLAGHMRILSPHG